MTNVSRLKRPTNQELATEFRALLTGGATDAFQLAITNQTTNINVEYEELLSLTKPWRNELWKLFAEIEERLDPLGVETRRRVALHRQLSEEPK